MTPIVSHPFSEIFPFREGPSFVALADSIAKIGQKDEIVLYEGKVLEGRRRQAACISRGITPRYRQFGSRETDGTDPLEFSYAINFHRRDDMTAAEKAIAAQKYSTFKFGENQYSGKGKKVGSANARPSCTQAEAARKFNTSVDQIKRAKKVMESGTPELQEALRQGTIAISDAAAIADEPPEIQREALEAVRENRTRTAKGAVAAVKGPAPEDAEKLARDLEALIVRLDRVETENKASKERAGKWLRKAVAIIKKL